jgi:magnesium transporter
MQNPLTRRRGIHRTRRRAPPGAPPGTLIVDPSAARPTIHVIAYGPDVVEDRENVSIDEIGALSGRLPITWVNVDGLGDIDAIRALGQLFGLHGLALEDVVNVHQRPKLEEYDEHLFIVTRMPHATDEGLVTEQVSLFLGRNFVLTFQEGFPGDCFQAVRRRIQDNRGRIRRLGSDYLAYALLDATTDAFFPILEAYGETIEALEDQVIENAGHDTVHQIHAIKRNLLTMRRAVWPQREMLNLMIRDDNPFVVEQTRLFLRDCFDHTFQLMDLIETYREIVSDLIDVFLSSMNARLNEVMKMLTIIATIFMPLTLVSGIYGMNFDTKISPWNMPELGWAFGYPAALGLMLAIALAMLLGFRRKGWLGGRQRRRRVKAP